MKKIISLSLSIIIMLSCFVPSFPSSAQDKLHIENSLLSLETQQGYIPGQSSSVQYNCFGFISDICQKLYGVTYLYEQQNGNYSFKHSTNYFTVAEKVLSYTSDAYTLSLNASDIVTWLKANAAVGDILQYGSADSNYSKKHTVLIQHIDDEKMQVIHSNYETKNVPATACRVDTVYWNSFIANPTSNEYDSNGNLVSLNLLLGSNMKLTQGMGLSLNRYAFLENTYYLDTLSMYTPTITKTERKSCTSIKVFWKAVEGAAAYSVEYRNSQDAVWGVASQWTTATDYTVGGLSIGAAYCFRVRAFVNGVWKDYSTEAIKSAIPPKPGKLEITQTDAGLLLSWSARKDISGCIVLRSDSENGVYTPIANAAEASFASYTDSSISAGATYYYKIQRYVYSNGAVFYSEMSSPKSGIYTISTPENVFSWSRSKKSLGVTWSAVNGATSYTVAYSKKNSNTVKYLTTSDTSCSLNGVELYKRYYVTVTANNAFGSSAPSSPYCIKVKPCTPSVTAYKKGNSVKLKWKKQKGITGYYVYRSYSKNGKYYLVKTIKNRNASSFTDKRAGTKCYYKVKSYIKRGNTVNKSNASKPVKAKK